MVDYGILRRIAVGKYALNPEYHEPPINELARVAFELPEGVACLTTALVLHGFNCVKDSTREIIHYAIPRSKWRSIIPDIFVKYHYFSKTAMTEGIVTYEIDGQIVNVYDIPKTICDMFKFRNKFGLDLAVAALTEALTTDRCTVDSVTASTGYCRMKNVMRPYLVSMGHTLENPEYTVRPAY